MKWYYDGAEWELSVDALPFLTRGGSEVANVHRDEVPAKPWRALVLNTLLPERWYDAEDAKAAAVTALADQLHKARCEVLTVLSECCKVATTLEDGGMGMGTLRVCSKCGKEF